MKGIAIFCAPLILLMGTCLAQSPPKKAHIFHGKVENVNSSAKSLTVNGEKVEGWMAAMTMDYKVDDPAILTKLKAGDQISATCMMATIRSIRYALCRLLIRNPRSSWNRSGAAGSKLVRRVGCVAFEANASIGYLSLLRSLFTFEACPLRISFASRTSFPSKSI